MSENKKKPKKGEKNHFRHATKVKFVLKKDFATRL